MTSSAFSIQSLGQSYDNVDNNNRTGMYSSVHAACESCYSRKQKCQPVTESFCQACVSLGIECRPRERNKMGRRRGPRQTVWRAIERSTSSRGSTDKNNEAPSSLPPGSRRRSAATSVGSIARDFLFPPASSQVNVNDCFSIPLTGHEQSAREDFSQYSPSNPSSTDLLNFTTALDFGVDFELPFSSADATNDLDLCDIHNRIRDALRAYRNMSASPASDRGAHEQENICTIEELCETMHRTPQSRPVLLLGVAVLWDAVELSSILSNNLIVATSATDHEAASTRSLFQFGVHETLQSDEHMHTSNSVVFPAAPSTETLSARNRYRASILGLTRLDLCLSDFVAFSRRVEQIAIESGAPVLQQMSECRMRIGNIHGTVTRHIQQTSSMG